MRITDIVIKVFIIGIPILSRLGFCKISRSKGNSMREQKGSLDKDLREYVGVNKDVQIPLLTIDRNVFRIRSTYF
jgi:hypothetical protein